MSKVSHRLQTILKKIDFIDEIVAEKGSIIIALEDEKNARASIMMHFTSIAEQFNKLAIDGEFEVLQKFDKRDLKGAYDMRNYIVHDYEGLNLSVIELVIRQKLPEMKRVIEEIFDRNGE
jgi:uncharacterized protein with HEPN domain